MHYACDEWHIVFATVLETLEGCSISSESTITDSLLFLLYETHCLEPPIGWHYCLNLCKYKLHLFCLPSNRAFSVIQRRSGLNRPFTGDAELPVACLFLYQSRRLIVFPVVSLIS